jgi:hypothetical protein
VPRDPKDFITFGKVLKNEHGECVREISEGIVLWFMVELTPVEVTQNGGGRAEISL